MEDFEELEDFELELEEEEEDLEVINRKEERKEKRRSKISNWVYGIILTPCIAYLIWLFFFLGKQILNR